MVSGQGISPTVLDYRNYSYTSLFIFFAGTLILISIFSVSNSDQVQMYIQTPLKFTGFFYKNIHILSNCLTNFIHSC